MGNLCSCLSSEQSDEAKPTTPLLGNSAGKPSIPVKPDSPDVPPSSTTQSARRRVQGQEQDFLASIDEIADIQLSSVSIPSIDKSFQDHATLHNTLLQNHKSLRSVVHDYKELFLSDTAGIPVMAQCVKAMKVKCGNAKLSIGRKSKYCIEIDYDARDVSKEATDYPENVISSLQLFNRANKLIKDIMDHFPNISSSVRLVLADENGLRKEVTKADLGPMQGPQSMKNCVENIAKMRKIPSAADCIQRDAQRVFDEILEGSKSLFENPEPKLITA